MSSFNDYCETIEFNNEILSIYMKVNIKDNVYYICDDYRVFKNKTNNYIEIKDKKILKIINNMIILNKD